MSFSMAAKDEICTQAEERGCCIIAELCAITLICGNLSISHGGVRIKYNTESMTVAKRIYDTVTRILKLDSAVEIKDNLLKKKHSYTIVVEDAALLLTVLGLEGNLLTDAVPPGEMLDKECCRAAILRGAFLGGGTVSNPKKNYHAEFVTNSEAFAKVLLSILEKNEIRAKIIHRRQNFVVYLNEGDGIAALLAIIGAYSSILNFENVRVLKEMRNNVNRAVNCETANIDKIVSASGKTIEAIQYLRENGALETLPETLRVAADCREKYPDLPLKELALQFDPPLSKSGLSHRMKKIEQIAATLMERNCNA